MNWYLSALKNGLNFSGRARRKEYWMFLLFNVLAIIGLLVLEFKFLPTFGILTFIYAIAMIIPSVAACIRRLHDTGRSGFWIFIGLVPLVGGIILLVFMCLDSEEGNNSYGENPKAINGVSDLKTSIAF